MLRPLVVRVVVKISCPGPLPGSFQIKVIFRRHSQGSVSEAPEPIGTQTALQLQLGVKLELKLKLQLKLKRCSKLKLRLIL